MTYSLTGCVPVDATKGVELDALVAVIASYAGEDGPNFCSLFSDEKYASVCFPGVPLDLPDSVTLEIESEVAKLAPYKSGTHTLTRRHGTQQNWITL